MSFQVGQVPWQGDRLSQKITRVEQVLLMRRQVVCEKYSSGTSSFDNATGCQRKLGYLFCFFQSQLPIKKASI